MSLASSFHFYHVSASSENNGGRRPSEPRRRAGLPRLLPPWRPSAAIAYLAWPMEFSLRAIRPSDIESIHGLQRRIEEQDRIPVATPREELEDWLHEPHFNLATDSRLAEAGEVVAWGRVWHQPSEVRENRAYLRGAVDPALRGMGIGSALLRWQINRASEIYGAGLRTCRDSFASVPTTTSIRPTGSTNATG